MWPYAIGVLSAIVLAAIVFKIVLMVKASIRRKKERGIEMVKVSTIFRLEKKYARHFDPYFSRQLAQAVSNEVFAGESCGLMETRFAKYNARAIRNCVRALQGDTELIRVVSLSAHMESSLNEARGARGADSAGPLQRLENLGLLDSSAKVLNVDAFERVARDFHAANPATRKIKE